MSTSSQEATGSPSPSAGRLPPRRGNVVIQTHGCKLNQADSDALARRFVEAGYQLVESVRDADVYVLNTCTVTATADSKARQALRAARRANPSAVIVATGCYPQRAFQELSGLEAVSLVVDNREKELLVSKVIAAQDEERKEIGSLSADAIPTWSILVRATTLVRRFGPRTNSGVRRDLHPAAQPLRIRSYAIRESSRSSSCPLPGSRCRSRTCENRATS